MRSRQHFDTIIAAARLMLQLWEREKMYYLHQISLPPTQRDIAEPYARRRLAAVERKRERLRAAIDAYTPRGGTPPPASRA